MKNRRPPTRPYAGRNPRQRLVAPPLEKQEEAFCMNVYGLAGFYCVKTSQPQKAVGMTSGLPDLLIIDRQRINGVCASWWHEVKRRRGPGFRKSGLHSHTPAQIEMMGWLESRGDEVIVGGREVVEAKLRSINRYPFTEPLP